MCKSCAKFIAVYHINGYLCEHDIYAIMRIKLKSHKYNLHNVRISTVKIAIPHVEPHINKIHKLPGFFAKAHKFLGRINNQVYGINLLEIVCYHFVYG